MQGSEDDGRATKPAAEQDGGGFTGTAAAKVLAAACADIGVSDSGATLLRLGENAIFQLGSIPVVARIARGMSHLPEVLKEVRVARWLEAVGFPAVRLAEVNPQGAPIIARDCPVTFWAAVSPSGLPPTAADLGSLLRDLHSLAVPEDLELPPFQPFGRSRRRLASAPSTVRGEDIAFLEDLYADLARDVEKLTYCFPDGPVHGDAHPGNLMRAASGQVLLLDFEAFCVGPREWDLSLSASYRYTLNWYDRQEYESFVSAYGFDVTCWDGWSVLRRVREFGMTTWIMQLVADPAAAREFERRVADLRTGHLPRSWRPF